MTRDRCDGESALYDRWSAEARTGRRFSLADGGGVTILAPGRRNLGAGPDFLDALLLIDGRMRGGAVEMHRRASDWFAHHHEADPAYAQVLLHVVAQLDAPAPAIPTLLLDDAPERHEAASTATSASMAEGALVASLSWERLLRRTAGEIERRRSWRGEEGAAPLLLPRLFDALGLEANREPMQRLAEELITSPCWSDGGRDEIARFLVARAGISARRLVDALGPYASHLRFASWIEAAPREDQPGWRHGQREANLPSRRLIAAILLTNGLRSAGLLSRLEHALGEIDGEAAARLLMVGIGSERYVGLERGREIVVHALLPVLLARALERGDRTMARALCRAYRAMPSLSHNRRLARAERLLCRGERLVGAFWQQGAIEYLSRYGGTTTLREPAGRYLAGAGGRRRMNAGTTLNTRRRRTDVEQHL